MKKIKEEHGYTLVVALLLIVLFLSMSAVFIKSSMSHAKQEQTVDQGNMAVTAAEMGVEYYTNTIEKELDSTYKAIITNTEISEKLKNYNNCYSKVDKEQCKSIVEKEIENSAIKIYQTMICLNINDQIARGEIPINDTGTVKHNLTKPENQCGSFSEIVYNKDIRSFVIDLSVTGTSDSRSKQLMTSITIPFPTIIDAAVEQVHTKVTEVFEWKTDLPVCDFAANPTSIAPCRITGNVKLKDALANVPAGNLKNLRIVVDNPSVALCDEIKSGVCVLSSFTDINIYSSSTTPMKVEFNNQLKSFAWYHNGRVETTSPMNNSLPKFVFNSFSSDKPYNNYTGTMVLIGNSATEIINSMKDIKLSQGKICLNLSHLPQSELNNLKGKIGVLNSSVGFIYYHVSAASSPFDLVSGRNDVIELNVTDFYEKCGIATVERQLSHQFQQFTAPEVGLDVQY